jgi:calcineurin-like phosphoesterase family protein
MNEGKRYLWYSDTHLNNASLLSRYKFVSRINGLSPDGLFLTGDISTGIHIGRDLEFLAKEIRCDIYFILGNHEMHLRTIKSVREEIAILCSKYKNLHWLTQCDPIMLSEDVCVIGTEGWYDALRCDPKYLKFTFDWLLTPDFWNYNWNDTLKQFRELSAASAENIRKSISKCPGDTKEIFILTHFPPWPEADRAHGTKMEKFWTPYNTNYILGETIKEIAKENKKKRFTVLCGHTHSECTIRVRKNVECRVGMAKYTGVPRRDEVFIL